jgi:hypothetical protein
MATLDFKIQNGSGISGNEVFIGFWGSDLNATINGVPMKSIQESTWYKLSEIDSFVIGVTTSGRIYVAYYDPFSPTAAGGEPSIVAPNSPAYKKRFDKFELTFDGSHYGVADLTAIDYWSIPMSLETEKGGAKIDSLDGVKVGSTANEIHTSLSKLSNPVQSGKTGQEIIEAFANVGQPLAQGIQDQLENPASGLVTDDSGNFVRIIGPNTYPAFGHPASDPAKNLPPGLPFMPYNTFLEYFQYLIDTFGPGKATPSGFSQLGGGKIAQLAGEFTGSSAGSGPPCEDQTYKLWASIDNNFNLTIEGTGSKVGAIKMTITKWDLLNPAATYGGNPTFSLNGNAPQTPQNDIYAHILGDFFAGLNIGAIGSSVTVGEKVVGEMPSSEWFSTLPKAGYLFDKLWGGQVTNYWNQWAQELNPRSDAYNFAYAERFSAPQISIDPSAVDTLTLILLDADVTSSPNV